MRRGLGHSEPFGKRKPQTYLRSKPSPKPSKRRKSVGQLRTTGHRK